MDPLKDQMLSFHNFKETIMKFSNDISISNLDEHLKTISQENVKESYP
jgi:hypothetical protein